MTVMQNHQDSSPASGADAHYFRRLAEGAFEIPRCLDCHKDHFFPRLICPHCGSDRLKWVTPSGDGTVYSTTVVRQKDGNYNVCLVDLDEGPRMMSRVTAIEPGEVKIGMRVSARLEQQDGMPLLVFVPAEIQ